MGAAGLCTALRAVSMHVLRPTAHRFLTDKGIEHLREYLNLPEEIVPSTLKKSTRNLERGDRCAAPAARLAGAGSRPESAARAHSASSSQTRAGRLTASWLMAGAIKGMPAASRSAQQHAAGPDAAA